MPTEESWTEWGFRALIIGVIVYYNAQLNASLSGLTIAITALQAHLNETDKKVLAIEVSREVNREGYKKLLDDFDVIRMQVNTNSLQIQELRTSLIHKGR